MTSDSSQDGLTEATFTLPFSTARNKHIDVFYIKQTVLKTPENQATKD